MSRSPTLQEVIAQALAHDRDKLHVMLPGQIVTYDPTTQKANVQPMIRRTFQLEDGSDFVDATQIPGESLPQLTDVPVLFPRSRGFFVSFPLAPGDFVMLVFAEHAIDTWLMGPGAEATPVDFRRHDLSDAVAIPGFYPFSQPLANAHPTNLVVGSDTPGGAQIHVDPAGFVHVGAYPATDFSAMATPTEARLAALELSWATASLALTGASGAVVPSIVTFVPVATPVTATKAKVT